VMPAPNDVLKGPPQAFYSRFEDFDVEARL
jgi:hypothetical protein